MKIKPTIISMLLDILLSTAFYSYMGYCILNEEGWFVNICVFLIPLFLVIGTAGLLAASPPTWIDTDPKYERRYKGYLAASSIMYFIFMGVCASLTWYIWATLFALKTMAYAKVRIDYTVEMDWAKELKKAAEKVEEANDGI